jgi:hypothetical protein
MTAATKNNNSFVYVSSWDELTWLVNVNEKGAVRCNVSWRDRTELRQWIEQCCESTVYCWNGTSTPEIGSQNWHKSIAPIEDRCYLVFENSSNQTLFHLKFQSLIEITVFDHLLKAYHDSRN